MISTKSFLNTTVLLLMAALMIFPSCRLVEEEDRLDLDALTGNWALVNRDIEISVEDRDLVNFLMDRNNITRAEAEAIRTEFVNGVYIPDIRQISFDPDGERLGLQQGEDNFINGTYLVENSNRLNIFDDGNKILFLFDIMELRRDEKLVLGNSSTLLWDFTGDGINENGRIIQKMEFERVVGN